VKKQRKETIRPICLKTEGIRRWGRKRCDVGMVPCVKRIQREAIAEGKGERVSWEESWRAGLSGGGGGM